MQDENHKLSMCMGFIKISGIDAKTFLQGQLTCDMRQVTTEQNVLGACCTPQGRVIAVFRIFLQNDSYYLYLPNNIIDATLNHLKKYAIFSKVVIESCPNWQESNFLQSLHLYQTEILAGIPRIYPQTVEKFLPHELNLDLIGAVSFDKGCYTGQEIIARMHYRSAIKNRMYFVLFRTNETVEAGTEIYGVQHATYVLGKVVSIYKTDAEIFESLMILPHNISNTSKALLNRKEIELEIKTFAYFKGTDKT